MSSLDLNEVYQFVSNLVHRCGRLIVDGYHKEKNLMEKECFADIVTETDKLVEKTLIEAIKLKYPNHK